MPVKNILIFACFMLSFAIYGQELPKFGSRQQVIVLDNVIDDQTANEINAILDDLYTNLPEESRVEVVALFIDKIPSNYMSIANYAYDVAMFNGIGQEGADNGIVVVIAIGQRESRVEIGDGLEHILPDITMKGYTRECFIPYFKQADYVGAFECMSSRLYSKMNGLNVKEEINFAKAEKMERSRKAAERWQNFKEWLFNIIMVLLALFGIIFGTLKAKWNYEARLERRAKLSKIEDKRKMLSDVKMQHFITKKDKDKITHNINEYNDRELDNYLDSLNRILYDVGILMETHSNINLIDKKQKFGSLIEKLVDDYNNKVIKNGCNRADQTLFYQRLKVLSKYVEFDQFKDDMNNVIKTVEEYQYHISKYNVKDVKEGLYKVEINAIINKATDIYRQIEQSNDPYVVIELIGKIDVFYKDSKLPIEKYKSRLQNIKDKHAFNEDFKNHIKRYEVRYKSYEDKHYISQELKDEAKKITFTQPTIKDVDELYNELKALIKPYELLLNKFVKEEQAYQNELRRQEQIKEEQRRRERQRLEDEENERRRRSNSYSSSSSSYSSSNDDHFSGGGGGSFSGGGVTDEW